MATATKTKKKKASKVKVKSGPPKALTFKQLVARLKANENYPSLLKGAVKMGWLGCEDFLARMTEKELESLEEVYREEGNKRVEAANLLKDVPDEVGVILSEEKSSGKKTTLSAGDKMVVVDTSLYLTMKHRYNGALCYLSHDESKVIFSEIGTVAILPVKE